MNFKYHFAALIFYLSIFATNSLAHTTSTSSSTLSLLAGQQATLNMLVHRDDYQKKFSDAPLPLIQAYYQKHLDISINGVNCSNNSQPIINTTTDPIKVSFSFNCPTLIANGQNHILFNYDLFYGDLKHQHLLNIWDFNHTTSSYQININQSKLAIQIGQNRWQEFYRFLHLGVEHILSGYDHVLFVITLILGILILRHLLLIITSFTLAHSITIALSAYHLVQVPGKIVEPIIALSILMMVVLAFFNIGTKSGLITKICLCFGFGLFHGLGFGTILQEASASSQTLLIPLVGFNLGVEIGQLIIVVLLFLLLRVTQKRLPSYQYEIITKYALFSCGLASLYWFVQRLLV